MFLFESGFMALASLRAWDVEMRYAAAIGVGLLALST